MIDEDAVRGGALISCEFVVDDIEVMRDVDGKESFEAAMDDGT